jgi:hypothetical protein
MIASQRRFIINMLFITVTLLILGYALFFFLIPQYYFPYFPVIPFFLFVVTILVHIYLIRACENDPRKFTSKYIGAMGLKMFIYLVFLVVFLFLDTARAVPFLVGFLITYVTFTTYEVISILNFLKKGK